MMDECLEITRVYWHQTAGLIPLGNKDQTRAAPSNMAFMPSTGPVSMGLPKSKSSNSKAASSSTGSKTMSSDVLAMPNSRKPSVSPQQKRANGVPPHEILIASYKSHGLVQRVNGHRPSVADLRLAFEASSQVGSPLVQEGTVGKKFPTSVSYDSSSAGRRDSSISRPYSYHPLNEVIKPKEELSGPQTSRVPGTRTSRWQPAPQRLMAPIFPEAMWLPHMRVPCPPRLPKSKSSQAVPKSKPQVIQGNKLLDHHGASEATPKQHTVEAASLTPKRRMESACVATESRRLVESKRELEMPRTPLQNLSSTKIQTEQQNTIEGAITPSLRRRESKVSELRQIFNQSAMSPTTTTIKKDSDPSDQPIHTKSRLLRSQTSTDSFLPSIMNSPLPQSQASGRGRLSSERSRTLIIARSFEQRSQDGPEERKTHISPVTEKVHVFESLSPTKSSPAKSLSSRRNSRDIRAAIGADVAIGSSGIKKGTAIAKSHTIPFWRRLSGSSARSAGAPGSEDYSIHGRSFESQGRLENEASNSHSNVFRMVRIFSGRQNRQRQHADRSSTSSRGTRDSDFSMDGPAEPGTSSSQQAGSTFRGSRQSDEQTASSRRRWYGKLRSAGVSVPSVRFTAGADPAVSSSSHHDDDHHRRL